MESLLFYISEVSIIASSLDTELKKVKLPASLKKIGAYAFAHCENLEEINLPKELESIGDFAFYHCEELKEIKMPNSVTEIGIEVFEGNVRQRRGRGKGPRLLGHRSNEGVKKRNPAGG